MTVTPTVTVSVTATLVPAPQGTQACGAGEQASGTLLNLCCNRARHSDLSATTSAWRVGD